MTDIFDTFETVTQHTLFSLTLIAIFLYLLKKFGMLLISRGIRRGVEHNRHASTVAEQQREDTIIGIIDAVFKVFMWVLGSMLILAQLGVNIGPLLAGVSFIGVAVGFGAQSLVKDIVAGLFIVLENQYKINDIVTLAGITGSVEDITIRQTILRDLDGNRHHIPNGLIDVATNLTTVYSNINLNVGVGYDSDIKLVEETVNKVGKDMLQDKEWTTSILEPIEFIRVDSFGASEVVVKIMGKVRPGTQWAIAGEYRKRLKAAFAKAGIEIPFQQIVTHKAK